MKTLRLILAMSLLSLLCGCITRPTKPGASPLLIGPLLDRIVPGDFNGDGEFGERGQYLTIEIKAGGLRKNENLHWTWIWLQYRRTLNIPVFFGVPYKQEGWIYLSTPKTDAAPKAPAPIDLSPLDAPKQ